MGVENLVFFTAFRTMLLLVLRGVAHPSFARPPLSYPGTVGLILGSTPLHAYLLRAWGWVLERPHPPPLARAAPPPSVSFLRTRGRGSAE